MKKKGTFMHQFDAHDAKMTHNIKLCSKWNEEHNPFIFCKCKRSEGVINCMTHECKMTNDEDHLSHYEKSAVTFTMKCNQDFSPKNVGNHCNWREKIWNNTRWHSL